MRKREFEKKVGEGEWSKERNGESGKREREKKDGFYLLMSIIWHYFTPNFKHGY